MSLEAASASEATHAESREAKYAVRPNHRDERHEDEDEENATLVRAIGAPCRGITYHARQADNGDDGEDNPTAYCQVWGSPEPSPVTAREASHTPIRLGQDGMCECSGMTPELRAESTAIRLV